MRELWLRKPARTNDRAALCFTSAAGMVETLPLVASASVLGIPVGYRKVLINGSVHSLCELDPGRRRRVPGPHLTIGQYREALRLSLEYWREQTAAFQAGCPISRDLLSSSFQAILRAHDEGHSGAQYVLFAFECAGEGAAGDSPCSDTLTGVAQWETARK